MDSKTIAVYGYDKDKFPYLRRKLSSRKDLESIRKSKSVNKFIALGVCLGLSFRNFRAANFAKKHPDCPTRVIERYVVHKMPEECGYKVGASPPVQTLFFEVSLLVHCLLFMLTGNSVRYEMGFRWFHLTKYNSYMKTEVLNLLEIESVETDVDSAIGFESCIDQPNYEISADEEILLAEANDLVEARMSIEGEEPEDGEPSDVMSDLRVLSTGLALMCDSPAPLDNEALVCGISNTMRYLFREVFKLRGGIDHKVSKDLGGSLLNNSVDSPWTTFRSLGYDPGPNVLEVDGPSPSPVLPMAILTKWQRHRFLRGKGLVAFSVQKNSSGVVYGFRSSLLELADASFIDPGGSSLRPPGF